MVIFNSYVKLPEGTLLWSKDWLGDCRCSHPKTILMVHFLRPKCSSFIHIFLFGYPKHLVVLASQNLIEVAVGTSLGINCLTWSTLDILHDEKTYLTWKFAGAYSLFNLVGYPKKSSIESHLFVDHLPSESMGETHIGLSEKKNIISVFHVK